MFNLADYTAVLTRAEKSAVEIQQAVLVVYYGKLAGFGPAMLYDYVERLGDADYKIAASVDHHGTITESKWVKEQIEKLGEVAA